MAQARFQSSCYTRWYQRKTTHNLYNQLGIGIAAALITLNPLIQPAVADTASLCPKPALARLKQHQVSAGETLGSIARRYRLIPATIMGFNPSTRNGQVKPGQRLVIPPFNGIQVQVPARMGLKTLAKRYQVRADVLFELNGCIPNPRVAFIPGVNWSPARGTTQSNITPPAPTIATSYPLQKRGTTLMGFGWKLQRASDQSQVALHPGVDLAAAVGSPVFAAASGIVAFVGPKSSYGQLVVVNHSQGYQTRYAQLGNIRVKRGQRVQKGQRIGSVGQTGRPSSRSAHLHFELRSNSKLGWVAEDPATFLR